MMATLTKNGNSACAALRDKKSTIALKAPFRHYYIAKTQTLLVSHTR